MRPKPKLACYERLEAYLEALIDWKFEQRAAFDREWLRGMGIEPASDSIDEW